MAGAVTKVEETFGTVKKITFSWTSDATGAADTVTDAAFSGELRRLVTVPGTAGAQPTNLYGVVIKDQDGTDALMGAGASRSNANTEQVQATSLGIVANDKLTLNITGAGNAKSGTVYLYIR